MTLWEAAQAGDFDQLRAALDAAPDQLNATSPDGWTPLHLAAHFGHASIAAYLLALEANPLVRSANALSNLPMHAAAGRPACGSHRPPDRRRNAGGRDATRRLHRPPRRRQRRRPGLARSPVESWSQPRHQSRKRPVRPRFRKNPEPPSHRRTPGSNLRFACSLRSQPPVGEAGDSHRTDWPGIRPARMP